jgi:hypothetical protein
MAKLTGAYNEYGYVVRKNSRVIYAAGNSPYESQTYRFSRHGGYGSIVKDPIPEDANVESLEEIEHGCKVVLSDMAEHPELYDLKGEYEAGKVLYSKTLNPLEEAYKCGALTK